MNQGLNNQNQFITPLSQAQMEQMQALLRSSSYFPFMTGNNDLLQNLSRMNVFQDLIGVNPNSQGQKDLFNQYNQLTQNLQGENNQANYQKLLQHQLQLTQLLGQQMMMNYPYNQMQIGGKMPNTASNPICVDDDEPFQQSRKCHNSQCTSKGDRKVKSKKQEQLYFCEKCLRLYNKGNFCDFCEQVYSNGSYDQDEVGWIQCDQCQKWNHLQCEAKNRNQNIQNEPETTSYFCLSCSKNIKKQEQKPKQPKKIQTVVEGQTYKPRQGLDIEDTRREKNITFLATKDNKVQFTFRLNLYDDEIKNDLEQLRNSGKKIKKSSQSQSQIQQLPQFKDQPQQQYSQQQLQQSPVHSKSNLQILEERNSESQLGNSRLRTRKQKYKVNYRDLGGEY